MKKILAILLITLISCATAQEKLNNYKYVLIPSKFEFQKTENQYNINLLLKYKFQQMGFDAYLDTDELPREVKTNSCSYLKPLVTVKRTMFKNALSIQVYDCDNVILYETLVGESREKSNKVSYNEALRKSLKSFGDYQLEYSEKPVMTKNIALEPVLNIQKEVKVLEDKGAISEVQKSIPVSDFDSKNYLIAESTALGFVLKDNLSSKVIHQMFSTKLKDVYLLEGSKGIIYKKEGVWVHEYIYDQKLVLAYLEIKF